MGGKTYGFVRTYAGGMSVHRAALGTSGAMGCEAYSFLSLDSFNAAACKAYASLRLRFAFNMFMQLIKVLVLFFIVFNPFICVTYILQWVTICYNVTVLT